MIQLKYDVITVGTELTLGFKVNENASVVSKMMTEAGFVCRRHISVPDEVGAVACVIRESLASDVNCLIITGGLGPTFDDVTREALSIAFSRQLVVSQEVTKLLMAKYGTEPSCLEMIARQAAALEDSEIIPPDMGSAPGMIIKDGEKFTVALPGVPVEMKNMLKAVVLPKLVERFSDGIVSGASVIKTIAPSECWVERRIDGLTREYKNVTFGIIASPGEVEVELVASGRDPMEVDAALKEAGDKVRKALGGAALENNGEEIAEITGKHLEQRGLSLGVAESCTGGLVAKMITDIPGSSRYFKGGIVSYDMEIKAELLGIPRRLLRETNAVSAAVARAMAEGARRVLVCDIGLGVTGVAGPEGVDDLPVGLVHIGLATPEETLSREYMFRGSRSVIRRRAAITGIDMIRRKISSGRIGGG